MISKMFVMNLKRIVYLYLLSLVKSHRNLSGSLADVGWITVKRTIKIQYAIVEKQRDNLHSMKNDIAHHNINNNNNNNTNNKNNDNNNNK